MSDQWLPPFVIVDDAGKPVGTIEVGDSHHPMPDGMIMRQKCRLTAPKTNCGAKFDLHLACRTAMLLRSSISARTA